MHYRNGREAKNGDKIVRLHTENGTIEAFGVLHGAKPNGGEYCNGNIAVVQSATEYACLCDCLHIDDLAEMLVEKRLEKRPMVNASGAHFVPVHTERDIEAAVAAHPATLTDEERGSRNTAAQESNDQAHPTAAGGTGGAQKG